MGNLLTLVKKHTEFLLYVFFGALTTIINIVFYYIFYDILFFSNVASTVIAWVASVIFAYITNKLFVFESRSFKLNFLLREAMTFFSARAITGVLDVAIMYITVDVLAFDSTICKLASNVLVIILNYIFSKLWIFKK